MSDAQKMLQTVQAGDLAGVKQLLAADPALVNARSANGISAILLAVYHGHQAIVDLLLASKPELNVFEAATAGQVERLKTWIESDAGLVNSYSADGWTPLHLAAFFGHEPCAVQLVANGALLNALSKNSNGNTPLHAAVVNRKLDMVKFLLGAEADVNLPTQFGWTALHLAAHGGSREMIETLMMFGADAKAKNDKGQTALEIARERGHQQVAELLAQYSG